MYTVLNFAILQIGLAQICNSQAQNHVPQYAQLQNCNSRPVNLPNHVNYQLQRTATPPPSHPVLPALPQNVPRSIPQRVPNIQPSFAFTHSHSLLQPVNHVTQEPVPIEQSISSLNLPSIPVEQSISSLNLPAVPIEQSLSLSTFPSRLQNPTAQIPQSLFALLANNPSLSLQNSQISSLVSALSNPTLASNIKTIPTPQVSPTLLAALANNPSVFIPSSQISPVISTLNPSLHLASILPLLSSSNVLSSLPSNSLQQNHLNLGSSTIDKTLLNNLAVTLQLMLLNNLLKAPEKESLETKLNGNSINSASESSESSKSSEVKSKSDTVNSKNSVLATPNSESKPVDLSKLSLGMTTIPYSNAYASVSQSYMPTASSVNSIPTVNYASAYPTATSIPSSNYLGPGSPSMTGSAYPATTGIPSSNYLGPASSPMPCANFLGSSGFSSPLGSLPTGSLGSRGSSNPSPRSSLTLMSPYEALSPNSPFSDPILSSPYGSIITSKKDFQSPYDVTDSDDVFSNVF